MARVSPSQSGVFNTEADQRVERFTESVSFDRRLYAVDISGSIAHAQMLADVGVLTAEEAGQIETTLLAIKAEIDAGDFEFQQSLEDVHMNIEKQLVDRLGDVGRKLHTGRSRNDQIATDTRLWVREAIDAIDERLETLQRAFVGRCDADAEILLPAYTHLQRAQPVLAPHYWLAYVEKLARDRTRLADCRRRVNICSLGTAALAGTTLPINRHNVAQRLGFEDVARNSLDVSSDRDYLLEFAFCLTLIAEHLSTWADEWVLWSTVEFNFIKLPQQFCTGSSIMPQKINPDVCELVRGKSARVIGNLQSLLVLVKGLPLAYNRDLQEDKEPLFDSYDTVSACLELAAPIVAGAELKVESIRSRLDRGFLDATTLMEHLIKLGTPQRTAHHQIGALVKQAMEADCRLADLPLEAFQALNPSLDESVYDVLGVDKAVAAFQSYGSTAPSEVKKQVRYWKEQLNLD
ncbi:argininosuccinate lyase [Blastopirellula sp. JC732]|uniref:Argininosuccinate lyase n=1 Tax=Blastopirellula sediminis TaxID=2894196 RepID=A0A9X1SKT4_9BACT|nr:argininosuccinate lyase [Blastopirellula sediminis]MCC9606583.1 argininosuccinate lyase [Blastopirellula sediminis]MCC9630119.1 argininosuccinate lyase [Blastopirellula sediminis]